MARRGAVGARALRRDRGRSALVVDRAGHVPVAVPAPAGGSSRSSASSPSGNADFTSDVISELGLQGEAAEVVEDAIVTAEGSKRAASIIGLVGLLWAGLAVVGAMQAAFNAAWQVLGRGLLDRAFALALAHRAGSLFLVTAALGPALSWLPGVLVPVEPRSSASSSPPCSSAGPTRPSATTRSAGGSTSRARSLVARRLRDPQGRRHRVPAPPDRRILRALRLDRRGVRHPRLAGDLRRASSSTAPR